MPAATNSPTPADADVWVVAICPMPSDVPVAARVKALLKAARRVWKLRAVTVRRPTAEENALLAVQGENAGRVGSGAG